MRDLGAKFVSIFTGNKSELIRQDKKVIPYIRNYDGKTRIFIVADYDREDDILNQRIEEYAKNSMIEIIWMNRDIEEVYWGSRVSDKQKENYAKSFNSNYATLLAKANNLSNETPSSRISSSNILCVFDKYLTRKEQA